MAGLPAAVLFACTLNAIRSPMAEGLLKHLHGRRIYVDSAGVHAEQVSGFAVEAMNEIGIDISGHRAKRIAELADTSYDLVISLSPEAQHAAVELTRTMACELEYWPTYDPSIASGSREARLAVYRRIRDELRARIEDRFRVEAGG
jgi:protein-tyrosine-phosphatase